MINKSWKDSENHEIFLIDNFDLRQSYGKIIGLIAYSQALKIKGVKHISIAINIETLEDIKKMTSKGNVDILRLLQIQYI